MFTIGFFCFAFAALCQTQHAEPAKSRGIGSWGVGINSGTYGLGGSFIIKIHPHLIVRAGYDYAGYTYESDDMTLDVEYGGNEFSAKINSLGIDFGNAKLLLDYYPFENGVFSLTGGVYMGKSKVKLDGNAPGKFELDDVVIQPDSKTGYFDASLVMGNTFKPYFGLGLGRTLANKRVGFRFDLGVVYQGHYKVESNYATNEQAQGGNDAIKGDLPISKSTLDLWPMLNFGLSYRFR